MKKTILLLLKWGGGIVLGIVLLIVLAVLTLNTSMVQNRLLQEAVVLLKEKLNTEVSIDHIRVNFFGQDMSLYGVEIEDLQKRKMLRLEELAVSMDLWDLMKDEVEINDVNIKGLEANLFKPSKDSAANFQFVIDAFKKKDTKKVATADKAKKKKKLTVDVSRIYLESIKVNYNDQKYDLGSLLYRKGSNGRQLAEIREVNTQWVQKTKKGPVDTRVDVEVLDIIEMKGRRQINITNLNYITDNNQPRKNSGKPKRGFFDVGHFNLLANANISLDYIGKDSVVARITSFTAKDSVSGIDIRELKTKVEATPKVAHLKDVTISLPNTTLSFESGTLQLPSKKEGRKLAYSTSLIKGKTLLKDISRPFAPVLKNFSEPLHLQVRMSGDDEGMSFRDVKVNTSKKDLTVSATGFIKGLKDKYKLQVHFDVHHMMAVGDSKVRIISQFPVKKFMMKQLNNLGRIDYRGHFDVLWKREQFAGKLTTAGGDLDFNFALDENNKYVLGTVRTDSFHLGKIMDMDDIKEVSCKADFKFDISKPRTAVMRKKLGGKLPIGEVNAELPFAKYKMIRVRNVYATLKSNGAIAEGKIDVKGKRVDLLCSFSFTNTNEMKKTKIKPGIKFHALSDADKAEKEAKKLQKAQEKARKAEEKAARKAAEAEEKAARKAAKAQEKAARKAAKEAEKAAKQAAEESDNQ